MSRKVQRLFTRLVDLAGNPSCRVVPEESPLLPHIQLRGTAVPNPSRILLCLV